MRLECTTQVSGRSFPSRVTNPPSGMQQGRDHGGGSLWQVSGTCQEEWHQ